MREILFRGKTKDGRWVEGCFCEPCNIVYEQIGYDEVLKQESVPVYYDDAVIPETLGQYTGFQDKNGKKIFEGDILKITFEEGGAEFFTVFWNEKTAGFSCIEHRHSFVDELASCLAGEIVGNIFDNERKDGANG